MSLLDPYDYELPRDRIARWPPRERDGGRLMVLAGGGVRHRLVVDLPELLRPGDLLVLNDTRVLPARLRGRRGSGGAVELLLLGPGPGPVEVMLRPGRRLRAGEVIEVPGGGSVILESRHAAGHWTVRTVPEPAELMELAGEPPLPPYLGRPAEPADRERYQTRYARVPGAAAAPTAGLHLSDALLAALRGRGIRLVTLTLHVGPGTFRPLREEDLASGQLHPERFELPAATASAIAACRERGGRVVAAGTTTTRVLEHCTPPDAGGVPVPGRGVTRLFLRPGHRFRCVQALLTNFHLPRSSLVMLVCAFGGRERVLAAYREAVREGYRFYSYGDAMLLT